MKNKLKHIKGYKKEDGTKVDEYVRTKPSKEQTIQQKIHKNLKKAFGRR